LFTFLKLLLHYSDYLAFLIADHYFKNKQES
jgi:hypothetical protein